MDIVIPNNRKRFPFVFIFSFLLTVALVINLIYTTPEEISFNEFNIWIFKFMALIVVLFISIISCVEYVKTVFDVNAALTISAGSIKDNLSILSCGEFLWTEISSVEIQNRFKSDFILIKLIDPNPLLSKQRFWKRYILKKWLKAYGTPIVISQWRIKYDLNELKNIMMAHIR